MSETVIVGCRLPFGVQIRFKDKTVSLNGANTSRVIGGDCGYTEVEKDFWEAWKEINQKKPIMLSGAIFSSSDKKSAKEKAKEFKDRMTGFEPLPQDALA